MELSNYDIGGPSGCERREGRNILLRSDFLAVPIFGIRLVQEDLVGYDANVTSPQIAADYFNRVIADMDRECFAILLLNTKNVPVGIHKVSIGSLNSAIVHPREVFKAAILANASSILAGHNHPSGDTTPSPEDRSITVRLRKAGRILGIEVLDHIIVGPGGNFDSALENGWW